MREWSHHVDMAGSAHVGKPSDFRVEDSDNRIELRATLLPLARVDVGGRPCGDLFGGVNRGGSRPDCAQENFERRYGVGACERADDAVITGTHLPDGRRM